MWALSITLLTVQFDVVDVPAGECVCVGLEVAEDARVAGAREVAVVLVDPELQAQTVHLQCGHSDKGQGSDSAPKKRARTAKYAECNMQNIIHCCRSNFTR